VLAVAATLTADEILDEAAQPILDEAGQPILDQGA